MTTLDLSILIFGIGWSFLLIYLIDNGVQLKQQLLLLVPVLIAAIGIVLFRSHVQTLALDAGFITTPFFVVLLYNLVNLMSWKINGRAFRLRMRNSRLINQVDPFYGKPIYHWTDYLFSFLILISLIAWPFLLTYVLQQFVHL